MTKRELNPKAIADPNEGIDVTPLRILIRDWRRRADAAHEEGDARGAVYDACAAQLNEALVASLGGRDDDRDRETLSLV